jgi:hypothetical protein
VVRIFMRRIVNPLAELSNRQSEGLFHYRLQGTT